MQTLKYITLLLLLLSFNSYGQVQQDTTQIEDGAITLPKLQDVPSATILGRFSGGTGEVEELTAPELRSLLNVVEGAHTIDTDTDTQLTEGEVDAFVANNGYSIGNHTVDTNTQLTKTDIENFGFVDGVHFSGAYSDLVGSPAIPTSVSDLINDSGFISSYTVSESDVTTHEAAIAITESQISDLIHTVDTDTQLDESQVDAFVANNGYSTGAHTAASPIQASSDVDHDATTNFVVGEHFLQSAILITESQISDLSHTIDTDTNLDLAGVEALGFVTGSHTVDTNTQNNQSDIEAFGFVTGAHTTDTNTQLTDAQVAVAATNEGFVVGAHTIDTNTQLDEAEVDAFVSNNNYSTGAHTIDTDTRNNQADVEALGFVVGPHTIDTNTQLSDAQVATAAINEGFVVGAHTVDTDTNLSQEEVEDFVGGVVVGGTDITATYDDAGGILTLDYLGSSGSTTVSDTIEIDLTLSGDDITADLIDGSIDEARLDISVNASLDLADSALQSYTETDGSVSNELQDLTLANDTLSLTDSAVDIDLSPYLDDTDTNAETECTGSTVYLDGEGNCDTLISNVAHTGDVTGDTVLTIATGAVGSDELESTAVTAGSYTSTNITVDADGRITSASNGSGGGGGGGGASELSDLSDVNTSTPTNKHVLIADGVDFESRALTVADIEGTNASSDIYVDAFLNVNLALTAGVPATLTSFTEVSDPSNNFNSGTFTAPEAGRYLVNFNGSFQVGAASDRLWITVYVNGGIQAQGLTHATTGAFHSLSLNKVLDLNISDQVTFTAENPDTNDVLNGSASSTFISITYQGGGVLADDQSALEVATDGGFTGNLSAADITVQAALDTIDGLALGGNTYCIKESGRTYLYDDERWITGHDDVYGAAYYQNAESGTTSVDPVQEWEHMGIFIAKGETFDSLAIFGRITDATNVEDMEVMLTFTEPDPARWADDGFDSDSEDVHTTLFRDLWLTPTTGAYPVAVGAGNDQYLREIAVNFTAPENGQIRLYFKPQANPTGDTAVDYFYNSRSYCFSN